jgi:hypothetical protein
MAPVMDNAAATYFALFVIGFLVIRWKPPRRHFWFYQTSLLMAWAGFVSDGQGKRFLVQLSLLILKDASVLVFVAMKDFWSSILILTAQTAKGSTYGIVLYVRASIALAGIIGAGCRHLCTWVSVH